MISKEEFKQGKVSMKHGTLMLNDKYDLMHESEKEEIQKQVRDLCKKYKPKRVLEIGFGLGYTATEFQKQGVEEHTIVEAHPEIFKDAEKWAKGRNVKLVNKFIQDFEYNEEDYDLIYDDRQELVEELKAGIIFPNYKIISKI